MLCAPGSRRAHPDLEAVHPQAAVGGGEALFAVAALRLQVGVVDDVHGRSVGDVLGPVCGASRRRASPERAIAAGPQARAAPESADVACRQTLPPPSRWPRSSRRGRAAPLVERQALERSLGQALQQHKLTLLLAPAGYGKTAALTRQIRQLPAGCALAWVSADDDDPLQRFLACLTAALEPFDLPWRVAPEALATLAMAERGLGDVAGELVNALAAAELPRGLIVVDDLHRISDPQVFELLHRMLERWPERWGLVLASRVEPPLPLARLRAAGELAEFGQRQLRFSPEEVEALAP